MTLEWLGFADSVEYRYRLEFLGVVLNTTDTSRAFTYTEYTPPVACDGTVINGTVHEG